MTPEEAQAICPDLTWLKRANGSLACRHRLDIALELEEKSEMCSHGSHFVCELVLHQIRKKAREERDGEQALSVSKLDKLAKCPRLYAFDYVHKLKHKARVGPALRAGTAFGTGRAKIDIGLHWEPAMVDKTLTVIDRAKVKASLRYYLANPPYPVETGTCEDRFDVEFDGHHWTGFTDWLSLDRSHIVEWKYADKEYDFLRIVRQASVYFMAIHESRTFELIRFAKPRHKPRSKEKWNTYEDRVFEELSKKDPSDVYDRLVIDRRSYRPEFVVRQMTHQAMMIGKLEQLDFPPSYGEQCRYCSYAKGCRSFVHHGTAVVANQIQHGEVKL